MFVVALFVGCMNAEEPVVAEDPVTGETGRLVGFTEAHNAVRATVDVPDLIYDVGLERPAEEWLDNLVENEGCDLIHNYDSPYGENLAWNKGFASDPTFVTEGWASEVQWYDYDTNTCNGPMCGHYTQIIWESTERLGCAMRECNDGAEIWMCNYDPPGNIVGRRPY